MINDQCESVINTGGRSALLWGEGGTTEAGFVTGSFPNPLQIKRFKF